MQFRKHGISEIWWYKLKTLKKMTKRNRINGEYKVYIHNAKQK